MAKCVLVVDDSETLRKVLQLTLSNAGFDDIEAEDGDDALNKLTSTPVVDKLITDLNMPNMDGLELMRRIREDKVHRFTPNRYADNQVVRREETSRQGSGASAWIVKPFKPGQLLKVVKMVLDDQSRHP